VFLMKTGWV